MWNIILIYCACVKIPWLQLCDFFLQKIMKNLSWAWVPQTNFFKYNLLEKLGWVPQSKFMHLCQFWDMFVIISILPSTFLVTYQSIFDSSVAWQWAIVYTGDFIYVVAMGLRFFRSYVTDRGEWITDREKIVFHYLRTYFFLDLFSVMPFEIFTFLGDITDKTFTLAMWRLNRYIRLYRVWMFLCKIFCSFHRQKNRILFLNIFQTKERKS